MSASTSLKLSLFKRCSIRSNPFSLELLRRKPTTVYPLSSNNSDK